MKFTATTIAALLAISASAELIVLDTRNLDVRGLDDFISSITSKVSSKVESVTDAVADGITSGSSVIASAKTAFNDASSSKSYQMSPSAFTFPAVATATADANKLYEYITSVDKFIPTKVVDEWKDGETPSAVASFVKELPEKYTVAAKNGWASLSAEVKKQTTTPTASSKKDDDDDDEDDKKDDKKDDDDDEESGALRTMGVSAAAVVLAGVAGMAIIL
jgi:hypothetical protein